MSVSETGEAPDRDPHEHFTSDVGVCLRPTNKRWASRWLLIGLILATFFSMGRLVGAFQKEQEILRAKTIAAERFEIRGEDKKLSASLFKGPDGSAFLSFFDGAGNARLTLGIGANGSPIMTFFSDGKSQKMSLGVDAGDGTPAIHLFDGQGAPALSLGNSKGIGPGVTIGQREKVKSQCQLRTGSRHRSSKDRLVIMTDKDGTPSIKFLNPDGSVAKEL